MAPLTARVYTLTRRSATISPPFLHPKEAAAEAGPIEPPSCPSGGLIRRCEVNFADTPPSFRPQYTDFAFAKCGANHPAQAAPRSSAACRQTAAGSDVKLSCRRIGARRGPAPIHDFRKACHSGLVKIQASHEKARREVLSLPVQKPPCDWGGRNLRCFQGFGHTITVCPKTIVYSHRDGNAVSGMDASSR